jgi:hypothetical protein
MCCRPYLSRNIDTGTEPLVWPLIVIITANNKQDKQYGFWIFDSRVDTLQLSIRRISHIVCNKNGGSSMHETKHNQYSGGSHVKDIKNDLFLRRRRHIRWFDGSELRTFEYNIAKYILFRSTFKAFDLLWKIDNCTRKLAPAILETMCCKQGWTEYIARQSLSIYI